MDIPRQYCIPVGGKPRCKCSVKQDFYDIESFQGGTVVQIEASALSVNHRRIGVGHKAIRVELEIVQAGKATYTQSKI